MKAKSNIGVVYIGVIPGVKNLAGIPFRTDLAGMYHRDVEGCKYVCRINGGKNRYFFIEERYFFEDNPAGKKLGNIRKIHHFNRDMDEELPQEPKRMRVSFPLRNRRQR